jgi:hypothetical protein
MRRKTQEENYMCKKSSETSLISERSANSSKLTRTENPLWECHCVYYTRLLEVARAYPIQYIHRPNISQNKRHCCRFWLDHIVQLLFSLIG